MKLLLTSGGITNAAIAHALSELLGRELQQCSIAVIPTAANVEEGDKKWFMDDLQNLAKLSWKAMDIVDISAIPREMWQPRLEAADVLYFGGGNTFHLLYWLKKSGLDEVLPSLLQSRVYVGASAGSIAACRRIFSRDLQLTYEDMDKEELMTGLGFADIIFIPHMNPLHASALHDRFDQKTAGVLPQTIYAVDDETALRVTDEGIQIIGEGAYVFRQS